MSTNYDELQKKYLGSDYGDLTSQEKVGRLINIDYLRLQPAQRQTARETVKHMTDEEAKRTLRYFLQAASKLEQVVDSLDQARKAIASR